MPELGAWFKNNLYLLICCICAAGAIVFFFGDILLNLNTTYFASDGDGLGVYYAAAYHVKYDHSAFHQGSNNYPYGENVLYSGCPVPIAIILKLFQPFFDVSIYTVGILNFLMLISIPLSVLFIYLILKKLKIPFLYALLFSLGIAFLSPQIVRLTGHFNLTYQFAIPCIIYLFMVFKENPSVKNSIWISLIILFTAS